MIYKYGDMLGHIVPGDVYLVTTNSYIRKDGALVMGRGAAKQLAMKNPIMPRIFGRICNERCGHLGEYRILTHTNGSGVCLGAFQVKYHFKDMADIELIKRSVDELIEVACTDGRIFHLNYPGIGNGRLDAFDVEPIISRLPDNVNVWRFK